MKKIYFSIILFCFANNLHALSSSSMTMGDLLMLKKTSDYCEKNNYSEKICGFSEGAFYNYVNGYVQGIESSCLLTKKDNKTEVNCHKITFCWPSNFNKDDFFKAAVVYAYNNYKEWKKVPAELVFEKMLENSLKC